MWFVRGFVEVSCSGDVVGFFGWGEDVYIFCGSIVCFDFLVWCFMLICLKFGFFRKYLFIGYLIFIEVVEI